MACDERTIRQLKKALNAASNASSTSANTTCKAANTASATSPKMQLWPHEPGTSNLKVYFPAIPESVTSASEDWA